MKNTLKIFNLLSEKQKRMLPFVLAAMLLGSAFEVLGLGLLFPVIEVITNTSDGAAVSTLDQLYPDLAERSRVVLVIMLFASAFVIKGFYLVFLSYITARFAFGIKADINNRLMKFYVKGPYEYHLENNSSKLIRNITTESNQLVTNAINPILLIAAEVVVVLAIALFLLWIEPLGTLIVIALLVAFSSAFQYAIRKVITDLGKSREYADGQIVQNVQETLGGIKDVKVLSREYTFLEQFSKFNDISASASSSQFVWNKIPRMYLETLGVFIISALLLSLTFTASSDQAIPVVGVFSLAAFRLLPCFNRILSALNGLSFSSPVVENIEQQLSQTQLLQTPNMDKKVDVKPLSFSKNINIENIFYSYPNVKSLALNDISFTIKKGESIGIIGTSGAGKSTLANIILGLIAPTSGSISVDGKSVFDNLAGWRQLIGYVQQDVFLIDDSIRNNIAFKPSGDQIDEKYLQQALQSAQLDDLVASLNKGLDTQIGERGVRLSGGQKQRVGIARALYHNPTVLILDEATSALDSANESQIMSSINRLKGDKTTIIIAHRTSTLKYCDRIIDLEKGTIVNILKGLVAYLF